MKAAPLVLKTAAAVFGVVLALVMLSMFFRVGWSGGWTVTAFGLAAAVLGLVLVLNVSGAAVAMDQIALPARPGRNGVAGRWTARRFRLLGGFYVVLGASFITVGSVILLNGHR